MKKIGIMAIATILASSCSAPKEETQEALPWSVDRFADIEVLRYEVPAFESLSLQQKKLVYYLTEAAQWGRDILWDQNCKYNLPIRLLCEKVYQNYNGDKNDAQWLAFEQYMKQIWFANGIHHHYSNAKFVPGFTQEWFEEQLGQQNIEWIEAFSSVLPILRLNVPCSIRIFFPSRSIRQMALTLSQQVPLTSMRV